MGPSSVISPLLGSPLDDELRRSLVSPRLVALGRLTPGTDRMASAGSFSLTAAKVVIDRVHGDAAVVRHLSHVAFAAGFADRNVFVLEVSDLTDRGVAARVYFAHLARWKSQRRPLAFARHGLRAGAGGTRHLPALPFLQLDVVNHRAKRDAGKRKRVADEDVRFRTRHERRADLQAVRREDVALLAVDVVQQRDARAAVRVVLNGGNLRRNPALVAAKIDLAIALLVTAADETRRHAPEVAAAAGFRLPFGQRLFRPGLGDLLKPQMGLSPSAGSGRFVRFHRHNRFSRCRVPGTECRELNPSARGTRHAALFLYPF